MDYVDTMDKMVTNGLMLSRLYTVHCFENSSEPLDMDISFFSEALCVFWDLTSVLTSPKMMH